MKTNILSIFAVSTLTFRLLGAQTSLVYIPGDGAAGTVLTSIPNLGTSGQDAVTILPLGVGVRPAYSNDVGSAAIYDGTNTVAWSVANGGSLFFTGSLQNDGVGGNAYIPDPTGSFVSGDFTLETFFNCTGEKRGKWQTLFRRFNVSNVCYAVSISDVGLLQAAFTLSNKNETGLGSFVTVDDRKWHHMALTYKAGTREAALYLDGSRCASTTLALPLYTETTNSNFYVGGYAGGYTFRGWMDEIRLTQTVLTPREFLLFTQPPVVPTVGGRWDLDGTAETTVRDVTNSAASTVNGYAGVRGTSSVFPAYSSEVPATEIRDGINGAIWASTNGGSVLFTRASNSSYGMVRLADPFNFSTTDGKTTNFTAELFFRSRGNVSGGSDAASWFQLACKRNTRGNAWELALTGAGRFAAVLNLTNGTSATFSTLSTYGNLRFDDGYWHHAAISYNGTNRSCAIWLDYRLVSSATLGTPLLLDGGDIYLGSAGDAKGFDGWIDSFRITPAVLTARQFLSCGQVSTTPLVHWSFEETNLIGVTTGVFPNRTRNPLFNLIAMANLTGTYSNSIGTGLDRRRIFTATEGAFLHVNKAVLATPRSDLRIPENPVLNALTNFTAEFFIKVDSTNNNNTGVLRKNISSAGWNPTWALSTVLNANKTDINLNSRFDTVQQSNQTKGITTVKLNDGNWHHVAMTFDPVLSTATFYIDYVQVGTKTLTGSIQPGSGDLIIGSSGTAYFNGQIDEVRISEGILGVNQFLRAYHMPDGTRIILK